MTEPNAEDVDMLMALTDNAFARDVAIRRLKVKSGLEDLKFSGLIEQGNNNNLEQAINDYFEDPTSSKYQWDDSQFNSDRDGGTGNHGISFDIQGPDDLGPLGGSRQFDGAPSRPPSRTSNNRSPLSRVIDLTAEHAMADPRTSISPQDHADRELQQALAASRMEVGLPAQEEGITGMDEVHFGPATRNEYEQGKWEMVSLGKSSVQEIVVDPEPEQRKRDLNAPAFLKPGISNNRLNALVTMYHEIPLTRNAFLNTSNIVSNYGYDNEWWSGSRIVPAQVPMSNDGLPAYEDEEVAREFQRLMAFLDKTERAYGSADALANLDEVKMIMRQHTSIESAVLSAWRNSYQVIGLNECVDTIFSAGVMRESDEISPELFAILDLDCPPKDSHHESLYDIADELLWQGGTESTDPPYLCRMAEVVVFRVDGGNGRKQIDIPAIWYPDRYLKDTRQQALEMRRAKLDVIEKLAHINRTEDRLMNVPLRSGKIVKVKDLFAAALRHDEARIEENGVASDEDVMEAHTRPSQAAVKLSEELAKVMASIDSKLKALGEAKEKAIEELRSLSNLYTEQSSDPSSRKLHPYTLRGVSTSKQTMYICRRAEPDLIDMDLDGEKPRQDTEQWWRIHYAPMGSSPVTIEKTTEDTVLDAAKREGSDRTVLMYASDRAMNALPDPLPRQLESFVHRDNKVFRSELSKSISDMDYESPTVTEDSPSSSQVGPSSPGKRKFSEDDEPATRQRRTNVTERELRDEPGQVDYAAARAATEKMRAGMTLNGNQDETIIGIDPSLVSGGSEEMQEMVERSGAPMLAAHRPLTRSPNQTIDSMDLDRVVEDHHVREESVAVKHVGFVE